MGSAEVPREKRSEIQKKSGSLSAQIRATESSKRNIQERLDQETRTRLEESRIETLERITAIQQAQIAAEREDIEAQRTLLAEERQSGKDEKGHLIRLNARHPRNKEIDDELVALWARDKELAKRQGDLQVNLSRKRGDWQQVGDIYAGNMTQGDYLDLEPDDKQMRDILIASKTAFDMFSGGDVDKSKGVKRVVNSLKEVGWSTSTEITESLVGTALEPLVDIILQNDEEEEEEDIWETVWTSATKAEKFEIADELSRNPDIASKIPSSMLQDVANHMSEPDDESEDDDDNYFDSDDSSETVAETWSEATSESEKREIANELSHNPDVASRIPDEILQDVANYVDSEDNDSDSDSDDDESDDDDESEDESDSDDESEDESDGDDDESDGDDDESEDESYSAGLSGW